MEIYPPPQRGLPFDDPENARDLHPGLYQKGLEDLPGVAEAEPGAVGQVEADGSPGPALSGHLSGQGGEGRLGFGRPDFSVRGDMYIDRVEIDAERAVVGVVGVEAAAGSLQDQIRREKGGIQVDIPELGDPPLFYPAGYSPHFFGDEERVAPADDYEVSPFGQPEFGGETVLRAEAPEGGGGGEDLDYGGRDKVFVPVVPEEEAAGGILDHDPARAGQLADPVLPAGRTVGRREQEKAQPQEQDGPADRPDPRPGGIGTHEESGHGRSIPAGLGGGNRRDTPGE